MLFMVIERFRDNDMIPIYQRVRDSGRSILRPGEVVAPHLGGKP